MVHKGQLAIVIFFGIITALIESSMAPIVGAIVTRVQENKIDLLRDSLGILLLLSILKAPSRYIHIYKMNMVAERVSQSLRKQLQSKFMRLSLSFHNNYTHGSGGLISRIFTDVINIQHGLRMFADFFREPVVFVALLSYLFYLNWKLTFFVILALPPILYFLRQMSRSMRKYGERGQEDLERIASTVKESVDGVRIIQSFNLEKEMEQRFDRDSSAFLASRKTFLRYLELASPISELVVTLLTVAILAYITSEISAGRATTGDFVGYVLAILGLGAPVRKIQESYVRIQETIVAARRVFSIVDDPSIVPQVAQPSPFPKDWKTIELRGLGFKYGANPILNSVSLKINRGDSIAFVGASGSGKSTIVNLLERFFDPTSGEILIDGIPIQNLHLSDLRHHIAMVSQDVFLFSDTIERNIWAGDFSKPKEGVISSAQKANAHDFIMKMPNGYQSRVGDRGNLLSGGEKQRVSIARAFFKDAPILILDEATSALDSASEIEVQKGLESLMKGRTTFVIAHRLATIQNAAKICVLRQGEILETGTHAELLARKGEYSRLFSMQVDQRV